jgi:outer membrane receptor protein involved in Fe transport
VGGVRGVLTDNWDYDVSYLYGQTSSSSTYLNDLLAPNIIPRVNGEVCAAITGCIPYNVFTYQGVTPEAAAQLAGVGIQTNQTSLTNIVAYITGNLGFGLPAGDITMATGYQYGKPTYENISDTVYEEGQLLGQGGPQPSVAGAYSVDELFIEGNVPLLSGVTLVENLALDLAYRWSDYTTGFDTSTYRFGVDWQIIDPLRFRVGYNRAVRAPSINELFIPANLGLWSGIDPCAGPTPEYSAAQCALTGVTAERYGNVSVSPAGQYNGLFGGNPDLQPEEADTITAGIVWDVIDAMTVSVDYWDIDITDVIDNIDAELQIRQCAEFGVLCDNIVRGPAGNLWQGQQSYVLATNLNLGNQHWEGVDLAWAWALDGWGGSWKFDLIGTYMLTKETTPIPGVATSTYDCINALTPTCIVPTPEWRHIATATYDSESWWALTGRWRYYDDVFYAGTTDKIANDQIQTTNYLDLSAVFRFMDNSDLVVGMNNVLDEEPPLVGNTLSGNINNANSLAIYDQLGRYLFGNVTFRW